jgi:hypothetical protein
VLLKNTTRLSDETQSTLACIDWVSSAKHGIACPHDGGTEIRDFDGRFFRVELNIADGPTSAHRTFRAGGRYAVP